MINICSTRQFDLFTRQSFQLFILIIYAIITKIVNAQQSYCWEPCTYNCPKAGPRLCPPESILTYYDCCPGRGCCQYIKWPNLTFLILIIFMLISGCICCCFFLFTDARQRMFARQAEIEANADANSTPADASITNEATTNTRRPTIPIIKHEDTCYERERERERAYNMPSSAIIQHKRSTVV